MPQKGNELFTHSPVPVTSAMPPKAHAALCVLGYFRPLSHSSIDGEDWKDKCRAENSEAENRVYLSALTVLADWFDAKIELALPPATVPRKPDDSGGDAPSLVKS